MHWLGLISGYLAGYLAFARSPFGVLANRPGDWKCLCSLLALSIAIWPRSPGRIRLLMRSR